MKTNYMSQNLIKPGNELTAAIRRRKSAMRRGEIPYQIPASKNSKEPHKNLRQIARNLKRKKA